jgi:hypothetical protein
LCQITDERTTVFRRVIGARRLQQKGCEQRAYRNRGDTSDHEGDNTTGGPPQ